MAEWWTRYEGDYRNRDDTPAVRPLKGRTTDADYSYSPLQPQELRDAVGLGPNDYYDSRLRDLQGVAVEQVASALGMPPTSVERTDRYPALGPLMMLSAPTSPDDTPTIIYVRSDGDILVTEGIELVGPRLVTIEDPRYSDGASITYETDVSEARATIEEAVRMMVAYLYRMGVGNKVDRPDIETMLSSWAVGRAVFG